MSDEHKAALAEGRIQGRVVRRYLEALTSARPKRGRKRTIDTVNRRLAAVVRELAQADPLRALQLRQERTDLENERSALSTAVDLFAVEQEFIGAAATYGLRKGITYDVWRESGVPAAVLKKAGINRGG